MRYVRTFFATLAVTLTAAWLIDPIRGANTDSTTAYCNSQGDCIIVLSPDGTWDM